MSRELYRGPLRVVLLVPVLPYHWTLVDRAVLRDVEGVPVPFVSIEDLIVLKTLWMRPKDIADIHGLIASGGAELDAEYVRATLAGNPGWRRPAPRRARALVDTVPLIAVSGACAGVGLD
jgi:hypothetical protein